MSFKFVDSDGNVKHIAGAGGGSTEKGGGSYLHIYTTDFIGKTVTVSITDSITGILESKTSKFDSNGHAEFNLISIGTATLTVIDGSDTYTQNVVIPNFSVYEASINRFSATIKVNVVSGAIVTATSGDKTFSAVSVDGIANITVGSVGTYTLTAKIDNVTSDNTSTTIITTKGETKTATLLFASIRLIFEGRLIATVTNETFAKSIDATDGYTFYVPSIGKYTLIGELEGGDVEVEIDVINYEETTQEISVGFNFNKWLSFGRVTGTYPSLDAVLEDEKAIRQLMTVHASVDYLVTELQEDLETAEIILNNDLCAKWINLRDYALDKLLAIGDYNLFNYDLPSKIDNGITFTNNGDGTYTLNGAKTIDGDIYFICTLPKPIRINSNKIKILGTETYDGTYWINASFSTDEGAFFNWTSEYPNTILTVDTEYVLISAMSIGVRGATGTTVNNVVFKPMITTDLSLTLDDFVQYGKSNSPIRAIMDKSVVNSIAKIPKSTSDNANMISSGEYSGSHKYYAFNDDLTNYWSSRANKNVGEWLGYTFDTPQCVKRVEINSFWNNETWVVQGSNDNFATTPDNLGEFTTKSNTSCFGNINGDNKSYTSYRVLCKVGGSEYNLAIYKLQFYVDEYDTKYGYGEWVMTPLIPNMTSNNTPSGTVSMNDEGIAWGSHAWHAFDGDWLTNAINSNASIPWQDFFIEYDFGSPKTIDTAMIQSAGIANFTYEIGFQGYSTEWTDLTEQTVTGGVDNDQHFVKFSPKTVSKVRIILKSCSEQYSHQDGKYVGIREFQVYKWQPKGAVPIMTANNAPYGEVFANSTYSGYPAWQAFSDGFNGWIPADGSTGITTSDYIQYRFVNPVKVSRVSSSTHIDSSTVYTRNQIWAIQASNDNVNYEEIGTVQIVQDNEVYNANIEESKQGYYLYYRIRYKSVIGSQRSVGDGLKFQFYGRSLNVSVPIMNTDNFTPYGEAFGDIRYSDAVDYWKAFDDNSNSNWGSGTSQNYPHYLGYDFTKKIAVRFVSFSSQYGSSNSTIKNFIIQGSDTKRDDDWHEVYRGLSPNTYTTMAHQYYAIQNSESYRYYRIYLLDTYENDSAARVVSLQFYGVDYSEREFEPNSNVEYIYDHGVRIKDVDGAFSDGCGSVTFRTNDIRIASSDKSAPSNQVLTQAYIKGLFDITDYKLMRVVFGKELTIGNGTRYCALYIAMDSPTLQSGGARNVAIKHCTSIYDDYLELENANGDCGVSIMTNAGNAVATIEEWWLE